MFEVGPRATVVTSLHRAGVDNLSRLAFAVGQLGQAIQNNDVEDFLQRALGRASTLAEASSIKRMHLRLTLT